MIDEQIKEYWMDLLHYGLIFKVTLRETGEYDYYDGEITEMDITSAASVARIKNSSDNVYHEFWTEIHGKTLTTSSRTYEVVSVIGD